MTLVPALAGLLLFGNASTVLPVESVTLYRNGCGWVVRTGSVEVANGIAIVAIDASAIGDSWSIEVLDGGPKPASIDARFVGSLDVSNWGSWARVHRGQSMRLTLDDGGLAGRVTRTAPGVDRLGIESESGLLLIDPARIRGISATEPAVATLRFEPGIDKVAVRTSALVEGFSWRPSYRLRLGPDGEARLSLIAALRGAGLESIEAGVVECSVALPTPIRWFDAETDRCDGAVINSRAPGPSDPDPRSANDPTSFPLGAERLGPGGTRRRTLFERTARVEEVFAWEVAGPASASVATSESDRVETVLRITNDFGHSLPAGSVLVTRGSRPLRFVPFPYTAEGQVADLRLGPASGLDVRRAESELERKTTMIRGSKEQHDFVRMTGTLTIENHRPDPAKLEVTKRFEGDGLAASDDGVVRRLPNRVGLRQAVSEIRWDLEVLPGQRKRLTFGYRANLSFAGGRD